MSINTILSFLTSTTLIKKILIKNLSPYEMYYILKILWAQIKINSTNSFFLLQSGLMKQFYY